MQKESKSVVYFAGGLTAGVGAALIVNCVSSYALAAGIFLGRSSCDAVAPPDDDENDWPMIPDKSIPMDHTHGEDDDENADL